MRVAWLMTAGNDPPPPAQHHIRLHGPWYVQAVERTTLLSDGSIRPQAGPMPAAARMSIPGNWGRALGDDFLGRVRFERRFGCPSGLQEGDRVELVLDEVDAWADVWLNDRLLGRIQFGAPGRFEIRDLLKPRNVLRVLVEKPAPGDGTPPLPGGDRPGGITGQVRLVIQAAQC